MKMYEKNKSQSSITVKWVLKLLDSSLDVPK